MKHLFTIVLAIMVCGCIGRNGKTEVKDNALMLEDMSSSYKIREFEYDGCQYISFGSGHNLAVTHKGNCKYCQQRNK